MKSITLVDNEWFEIVLVANCEGAVLCMHDNMSEMEIAEMYKKYGEFLEIRLIVKD